MQPRYMIRKSFQPPSTSIIDSFAFEIREINLEKMSKRCDCCVNLGTGCMVIGLLNLVLGIANILEATYTNSNSIQSPLGICSCLALFAAILLLIGVQRVKKVCVFFEK